MFALSSSAHANPIMPMPGTTPHQMIALGMETLVIAHLLSLRKFDFIRILYTWYFITLFTYLIFIVGMLGILVCLENNYSALLEPVGIICALSIEIFIIWFEAKIILELSKRKFYRNSKLPFTLKSAMDVSFVGNMTSIFIGIILFFIR